MNTKILVADESPTIHKIVAMAFEDEGITVEGISRGEHALEYMVEYQPDIVLADIHLPGIDGYKLCQQIKNSPTFGSTRVILLTSDFEDIDQAELKISRADDSISKPFKTEEILKKVKSQLTIPESEKAAQVENAESSQEQENNEVIQNEFEDIINQLKESTPDSVKQLFAEDEHPKPSIEEIDLETDTPSEPKVEEPSEEKLPIAETAGEDKEASRDEVLPEIIMNIPEEAFRAETRPIKIQTDDLKSVFQSILASPKSGLEDIQKPEPGSKPNLIEEALSFMAHQQTDEKFETNPPSQSVAGETLKHFRGSTDHSPGSKIIKEHIDQVIDRLPEDAKHGNTHAALEKTVRDVLGEVAPKIIRQVIQEEIETIKKMKEA